MGWTSRHFPHQLLRSPGRLFLLALGLSAILAAGCGGSAGSSGSGSGPVQGESTAVTIQLSSAANDQFIQFSMTIDSISLTNKAGATTTIFNTPTWVEFISANGNAVPLATVTVPQDVYTSAAVTLSGPGFSYVFMGSTGAITFSTDGYGGSYAPYPPVVNLASPLTVSGSAMGLTLNLEAAQSGSITGYPNQIAYTISPTFTLSSFAIPAEGAGAQSGKCTGLAGEITAVGANSMTVTLAGHPLVGLQPLTVALNSSTVFQGVSSASGLAAGTLVNMDIAPQADATYAATRVEVQDATATDLVNGQLVQVDPSYDGYVSTIATEQVGPDLAQDGVGMGTPYMYGSATNFQTSEQLPLPGGLPFQATFDASTLAAGQMVALASSSITLHYPYTQPTSVTLLPQILDAMVTGESTSGNYTVYTAQLAPYDLIVQMNSPLNPPPNTTLPDPNLVYIYVGPHTSVLSSSPVSVGETFRFHGLLFNDAGTLRMVCDQVDDGVPQ